MKTDIQLSDIQKLFVVAYAASHAPLSSAASSRCCEAAYQGHSTEL